MADSIQKHPIMGPNQANLDQIVTYIRKVNPVFNTEIAKQFLDVGQKYGVRGDVAIAQSIHETNWFRYGGDVLPSQNNYAGLGATGGVPGLSFPTIKEGVTAQIQHLYAYAVKTPLPAGEVLVDPRFKLVTRGSAPNVEDLASKWAVPGYNKTKYPSLEAALLAGESYGQSIMKLYDGIVTTQVDRPLLVLDAGHGGTDPGAAANGVVEKTVTLDLVQRIAQKLGAAYQVDIKLTRSSDVYVALSDRAAQANQWGADLFLSMHLNAGGGEGYESYVYPGTKTGAAGMKQSVIHDEVMSYLTTLGAANRGKKEANFAVLRETRMPAVLFENLFVDHPVDASLLKNPAVIDRLADQYVKGIAKAMSLAIVDPYPPGTPAYKKDAVNWLYSQGYLTDESWKKKVDEPLPLWAEAIILKRMFEDTV
ncbi:N-acetylmuramoyl-L-alanine amidase [Paenibacillus sp. GCM10023252]|uniref:N-acetylmuramoyl-L-alanine amidase n=1 Tax=Paenibacillus sp. GCM10023252 TaxID=3252649 RepID=UPI00361980FD